MSIDAEIQDLINQLDRKSKDKIRKSIKERQFLELGEFSFFDDMSFLLHYGLTIKDNEIVIYTQVSLPGSSREESNPLEIPGSLDSYKKEYGLSGFPILEDIRNNLPR